MKMLWMLMTIGVTALSVADDLEPAVSTSSAVATPAATPAAAPAAAPLLKRPAVGKPQLQPKGQPKAHDHIDLDATQITGNRELPNVMYVVPWKKPNLGDFAGRPPKSLLDELLAPVDRDVFRRQNRYFAALHPDVAAVPVPPTAMPATSPATGAATTLPPKDEK